MLGPLRAWRDLSELDLGPAKQRAVLTVLLLSANRSVTTGQIIDAVWQDEPPDNGANVVQKYVAGLRRVLEPDRLPRSPGGVLTLSDAGYQLNVDPQHLDVELFNRLVRQAHDARRAGSVATAAELFQRALGLWRGTALAGLSGPMFDSARERLVEARAGALEGWADVELGQGNHAVMVSQLIELVAEFPFREELRYQLILALYRCGRQAEALAAFRDTRKLLAEEFGVEPGERLQELHRRILRSDPGLGASGASSARDGFPGDPAPDEAPGSASEPVVSSVTSTLAASAGAGSKVIVMPALAFEARPGVAHSPAPATALAPVPAAPLPGPPADAAYSFVNPAVTRPTRTEVPWWVPRLIAVLVPLLTCGLASWTVAAYYAVRRRSLSLGAVAAGLFLALVLFVLTIDRDRPDQGAGPWATVAVFALFTTVLAGVVTGALVTPSPARPAVPDPAQLAASAERARREQARQIARQHPVIARELGIGRPDLPRSFDDGGLVDLNGAPEIVIAALPGVGLDAARRIVADRYQRGALAAVEDLVTRELLPVRVIAEITDSIILLPPE
jgi:DNA-binding SARP family transcriptional activator